MMAEPGSGGTRRLSAAAQVRTEITTIFPKGETRRKHARSIRELAVGIEGRRRKAEGLLDKIVKAETDGEKFGLIRQLQIIEGRFQPRFDRFIEALQLFRQGRADKATIVENILRTQRARSIAYFERALKVMPSAEKERYQIMLDRLRLHDTTTADERRDMLTKLLEHEETAAERKNILRLFVRYYQLQQRLNNPDLTMGKPQIEEGIKGVNADLTRAITKYNGQIEKVGTNVPPAVRKAAAITAANIGLELMRRKGFGPLLAIRFAVLKKEDRERIFRQYAKRFGLYIDKVRQDYEENLRKAIALAEAEKV